MIHNDRNFLKLIFYAVKQLRNNENVFLSLTNSYSLPPSLLPLLPSDFIFRINEDVTDLELVHKTTVDEAPAAVCPYHGRLLVGVGRMLRLYDLGKKKLLRKCENKVRTKISF